MSEYIERPALMGKLTSSETQSAMREMDGSQAHSFFLAMVNSETAADVVEVKHGRWEDATWNNCWQTMTATCSNCHERGEVRVKRNECGETVINSPYCPNCGCKMGGE